MLRWWASVSIAVAVSWASISLGHAQVVAVAETSSEGADASAELIEMLGEGARHVAPPANSTDPDALLSWVLEPDVDYGALIALDVRRVYIVIPAQRRMLELVLPAEVSSSDDYAVALAASELLELAVWGADSAAEPPPEPPPSTPPDEEDAVAAPAPATPPRIRFGLSLGAQGWFGVPTDLSQLDPRIAFELELPRATWLRGHPFAEIALAGGGRDADASIVAGAPFRLAYAREELAWRLGLSFGMRRLELRPFVALALDWVRVRATSDVTNVLTRRARDDRAAITLGAGLELRALVGDRFFVSASVGTDALLGRTPYSALGQRILDEPYVRIVGRVGVGASFPKR